MIFKKATCPPSFHRLVATSGVDRKQAPALSHSLSSPVRLTRWEQDRPRSAKISFRQLLPTILFDLVLPVLLFDALSAHGVPATWALAVGALSPALNNLRVWIRARRVEPLGLIVMALMAAGTLGSLISGSIFLALIKDSFLTATFGFICLGSILTSRPLMFSVIRQFEAGDDPVWIEIWNARLKNPHYRAAFRFVTAAWGVTYLVEALLRVVMALVLTPQEVVTLSPIMGTAAAIILAVWTRHHMITLRRSLGE